MDLETATGRTPISLNREQRNFVTQRMLRLKILATEGLTRYRPLHWHLENIESMQKTLEGLKADLIWAENQTQLEIESP